ncbi:YccF domain-containing protein [Halorhabdus amylolytica]|uniref:YccF domain-containing protein n=1 Tax=Halorhabdus amylolytica TaxID=2559573 RepID=UPI0010A9E743|nr:YccF domain-containing protein [Halorhabdus amylolytica]
MSDSPSLIVRGVWFMFVGWWLTGIVLGMAWLLNLTVVGLPIGIKLINKAPYTLTLKSLESEESVETVEMGGSSGGSSPGLLVRGVYFVLIGWWASGLLTLAAYLISLTVIGLPIGVKLFNYLPYVVSLKKY